MMRHTSSTLKIFCLFAAQTFGSLLRAETESDLLYLKLEPAKIMELPGMQQGLSILPPLWNQVVNEVKKSGLPVKLNAVEIRAEGILSNDDNASIQVCIDGLSPDQIRYLLKYPLAQTGWKFTEKADGKNIVFGIIPTVQQTTEECKIFVHCQPDSKQAFITLSPSLPKRDQSGLKTEKGHAITGRIVCPEGIFPYPAQRQASQLEFSFFKADHADGKPRLKGVVRAKGKTPEDSKRIYVEATGFFEAVYEGAKSAGVVTQAHREMFTTAMNGDAAEITVQLDAESAQMFFNLFSEYLQKADH